MKYIKNKILRNIIYFPKNFCKTINAIYLCIRFPFLYPRNRWNGLHYNNWKLNDKITKLLDEGRVILHPHVNDPDESFHFIDAKLIVDKRKLILANVLDWIYKYPLQWIHCIPTYTELDAMDRGWRKAFGIQMCKELKQSILREPNGRKILHSWRIMQIKEKWGQLEWYHGCTTETQKIIHKYEMISKHTCVHCGKPATVRTTGWISPYCDDCVGNQAHIHFGHKNGPHWYGWQGNIDNIPEEIWNEEEQYLNDEE